MSPAIDPIIRLALALNSSRGAYAVLLGSGISAAAGVPTGRQVVSDLISKVAALEGESLGDDPFGWYRSRFGVEPDYSRLLDELAASPTERSVLLRQYFEPSDEHRRDGLRIPSAAHRALAQLALRGYVSVFLTTNFDRLLEQALESAGVAPTVLSTPDSLDGSVPLGRARCTVVKLNGDYLDTRIKNTPEELSGYHPSIDRLLDRVLDEYGLIVCGWSADWDTALRRAFERCPSRRYTTFWATRKPPSGVAAQLVELRGAEVIRIKDADTLFTDLLAKLAAVDNEPRSASSSAAVSLPARASSFIGRQAQLREVTDRLADPEVRLLTLTGPGGIGKTALAIRAAAEVDAAFADGVHFVDLSNSRETNGVLVAIARAIGVGESVDRPLDEVLTEHLRNRRMLLVLDNFEQVTAAAPFVGQLLLDCAKLHLLVTSREALHLRAEHVYPVPPLSLLTAKTTHATARHLQAFEAAQLFVDRAKALRPDFELTDDNAPAIAEICRRLDGLPLALELAAARLRLFSPQALRDQLQDRLELLKSGPRDLPERQQTLRATVNWSYELLTLEEQHLFELFAVFAGASVAAVEALVAAADSVDGLAMDAIDGLASLLEKSLIRRVDLSSAEPRVGMLETIRDFALNRLDQRPEFASRVRRVHAGHYAELARRLAPLLGGSQRIAALADVAADIDNLRIAWNYWVDAGDLEQLEKMAQGLMIHNNARGWYFDTVGLTTDMLSVLAKHASAPERIGEEIALRTTLARALLAVKGYTPEVEEAFAGPLELFERRPDAHQQFSLLRGLVNLYNFRGEVEKGARVGQEILAVAKRQNTPKMLIEGHLLVGASKIFIDDLRGGIEHFDRAIAHFAAVPLHAYSSTGAGNDPRVACYTTSALALWLFGRPDTAVERANAALGLAAELDHPFTLAFARFHTGLLHLWRRDFDAASEHTFALLEIADVHGFQIWKAAGTIVRGAAQVGLGHFADGMASIHGGMDLYKGLRSPPIFWPILRSVEAAALHRAGRADDGLKSLEEALNIMSTGSDTTLLPELQILKGDLLVAIAAKGGTQVHEAEECYRLALASAQNLNVRMSRLRAATRLCRTSRNKVDQDSALRMLEESYATFTEGYELLDLIEARELLEDAATARA
jgi:predicted ATPase